MLLSNSQSSFRTCSPVEGIDAGKVQFLEKSFPEWLGVAGRGSEVVDLEADAVAMLHWLHELIFIQGRSIESVRHELLVANGGLRFIAISSGKGGVGKTTCSVNLAFAMAELGHRVLLVDADLGLGNVHVFAGVNPTVTMQDFLENQLPIQETLTAVSDRLWLLCGGSGDSSLANLDSRRMNRLLRHLRGLKSSLDFVIIDTGAGLSPQVLSFLVQAQEIVVVTTPNIAATLDGYGLVKTIHEHGMNGKVRLLINQCANEEEAELVTGKIRACSSQFLGTAPEYLGFLTRDEQIEGANQSRQPFISLPDNIENAERLRAMAEILVGPRLDPSSPPFQLERELQPV